MPNGDGATPPTREADLRDLFDRFNEIDLGTLESKLGNMGQAGEAKAFDAFVNRAIRRGVSEDDLLLKLDSLIRALPAQARAETNLNRYARGAILTSDLGSLQNIYQSLPEGPAKTRIALATDAIGGGFNGQALGSDIEKRVQDPTTKQQALKDILIARALGATISDPVAEILYDATLPRSNVRVSQFLLLDAAVESNSRAEITLLAADLLGPLAAEAFLELQ